MPLFDNKIQPNAKNNPKKEKTKLMEKTTLYLRRFPKTGFFLEQRGLKYC